jgi:hypothetical protein
MFENGVELDYESLPDKFDEQFTKRLQHYCLCMGVCLIEQKTYP